MTRALPLTRAVLLVWLGSAGALAGCTNIETFVLSGQYYDEAADCLGEDLVIDVIEGTADGTCEGVRCIRSLETGTTYLSTICEAPELYDDLTDAGDPVCALALEAYEREEAGLCP